MGAPTYLRYVSSTITPPPVLRMYGNDWTYGRISWMYGIVGLSTRKSEDKAKDQLFFAKIALGRGVGWSEMAQEQRPRSIT